MSCRVPRSQINLAYTDEDGGVELQSQSCSSRKTSDQTAAKREEMFGKYIQRAGVGGASLGSGFNRF